MKIVHIITRLIVGGAQENTLLSCEGQHRDGHEVTLITGPAIGPEGSLMQRAESFGYRVIVIDDMRRAISIGKDYRTYQALVRTIDQLQPDIVHTHSSKAGIIGRWAAWKKCRSQNAEGRTNTMPGLSYAEGPGRTRRWAIVHTIHGLAFTASTSAIVNYVYKLLEKWTAPITDKIVCVADSMTQQSLAAGVGKPSQYVTVYSGMEIAPFLNPPVDRLTMRKQLGVGEEQVVVGTIARLFDLKGHDDLLDLAPQLCSRFPQFRFMWVGDGSLRSSFEKRIADMNLTDRFILTGLVPPTRIPELVNAMDIVAHPSRREGLARALPQGSLCGCACVTYDIDGAKEAVLDGKTGYVIAPFDKQKFGEAISKLLDNRELRKAMGSAGREFASQRFGADVMVKALEQEYTAAIAGLTGAVSTPGSL
jgi:glycosyltransferase involved in cell wall biosynthesis